MEQSPTQQLTDLVLGALRDRQGRIRAEDALSAIATIVAERTIAAAGDYELRQHDFAPGSRVLSANINRLLCGDTDLEDAPADSVFRSLRDQLLARGYHREEFPPLKDVFEAFLKGVITEDTWGKVPLSVPKQNLPNVLPLQVGFESRPTVDRIVAGLDAAGALRAATAALVELLAMVRDTIDRRVALRLTFETINGMAKTAPMTVAAMEKLSK